MTGMRPRYQGLNDYHAKQPEAVRSIVASISSRLIGGVELQKVSCPCKSIRGDQLLASVDRFGFSCNQLLCNNCGLIRISPRWPQEVYSNVYKQNYWALERGGSKIPSADRFALSVRRSRAAFDFIANRYDFSNKRVAEVGCSYGAALTHFKNKVSYVCGFDYDQEVIECGKKMSGVDLFNGGIDEALHSGLGPFDLLLTRHVFEHMLDPFEGAKKLRSLLKPDGLLFVEVPGSLNPLYWLPDPMHFFQVFHAYSYCLDVLSCIMGQAGLRLIEGNEKVYSLWKPDKSLNPVAWRSYLRVFRIKSMFRLSDSFYRLNNGKLGPPGRYLCTRILQALGGFGD